MHQHVVAHGRAAGAVERVEELAERDRGRLVVVGVLAAAGVGHDQRLGRGADRVEEQLPVLGADVALTGHRPPGQDVVAVDGLEAREDAVVEPDEAHHAVGHRAHRHHRAHGEGAGAEVAPRRPPAQPVAQQGAYVGVAQAGLVVADAGRDAGQLAVELRDPPRVVGPAEGEPVHRAAEGGRPVGDGRRGRGRPHEGVQAVDHLREAADEVEVAVADVVERERAAHEPVPLAGHRRTQEDALQAREPGVGVEVEPERGPVVAVVAPADGRLVDPPRHPLEVVVGEAEPGAHRLGRGEVEDGGGRHPAGRQLDEVGGDAEERVGGAG